MAVILVTVIRLSFFASISKYLLSEYLQITTRFI